MRWLTLAVCLLPMLATGAQHAITSNSQLPYTVSTNYDTVTISTDGLVAAGRILTINGGVTGTCIRGMHRTTYGANVNQGSGTLFMILDNGTNTKIENWKIRQVYPAVNDSVQAIRIGSSLGHHYDSVSVFVCGYESQCIYTDGAGQINIEYGHWASASNAFLSREGFSAAVMWFNDNASTGRYPNDLPYRTRVYGITIDSCPFAGIVMRGNGITIVDSNTIYMQTHNDAYSYPSGDMMHGAANCFAIVVGRNVPGHGGYASQISRNTIRALGGSGSTRAKEGGNGIAAGGSYGSLSGAMRVWGNDVRIAQGPDDYYGYGIPSQAFKTEERLDTLLMYDNYFETYADVSDATTDINRMANTIWLEGAGANAYWRVYNNQIIASVDGHISGFDVGTNVYAVALESECAGGDIEFRNNYIESNCVAVHWGSRNGLPGCDIQFIGDTINRPTPRYDDGSNVGGAYGLTSGCSNNYMTDTYFTGDSTIDYNGTGPIELTSQRYFKITVLGNDGIPFEGARVRVRNNYGLNAVVGTTDEYGTVPDYAAAIKYFHIGTGSDSTYSPFTISAIYGTDSVAVVETNVGFRTNLNDTLYLNTGGTGTLDTIAPGTVGDLSAAPAAVDGHMTFSWTSTGDDGASGTAAYDSVRFSTSPLSAQNWASATRVARTEAPEPAGVADQADIAETAPVPGQFYYVGIKAYDDAGHSSPLAVDSGFARGILAPQIAVDQTESDTAADRMTFYCPTVRSYLTLDYEFQISSTYEFPSPLTVDGTVQGGSASATFDIISGLSVVYVRCRAVAADQSATSPWSIIRAFDVTGEATNVPPEVPVAINPIPSDTMTSLTVTLMVANSEDLDGDPVTYRFELYNAAGTTRLAESGTVAEGDGVTTWTIPSGTIQDRTTYRWTARAYDGQAYSAWMDQVRFSVLRLASGDDPAADATVRAYPNPVWFAEGGTATFVIGSTPTDLTIMTVSGDIVLRREGVANEYVWDGKNQSGALVSAGLYLWFLSNGSGQGKLLVKPPAL